MKLDHIQTFKEQVNVNYASQDFIILISSNQFANNVNLDYIKINMVKQNVLNVHQAHFLNIMHLHHVKYVNKVHIIMNMDNFNVKNVILLVQY